MSSQRIEFIDLAKGVCIILVVLSHCHVNIPFLNYIRMPLYYLLSGLFFKQYEGFIGFTIRKVNKILIPFLFFYTVSFLLYKVISIYAPGIKINSAVEQFYYLDPLYSRLCFNNPLWFLISLFTVNIIFYVLQIAKCRKWIIGAFAIICVVASPLLKPFEMQLPLYLYKTIHFFPFFYLGYLLKKSNLLLESTTLSLNKEIALTIVLTVLFFATAIIETPSTWANNIKFYIVAAIGVLALLMILKRIKYLPIVSYFGRYSIIILCTSYLVYSPLQVILHKLINISEATGNWIVFFVSLIVEYIVILWCLKWLPHVTAQKDVIPVKPR